MPDLYCEWNQDLIVTPNGSVQTASGWDRVRQRIIRNLITVSAGNLPDGTTTIPQYIWHPTFGLSAGRLVGQNPTPGWQQDFVGRVQQAVLSDTSVDPGSVPTVVFKSPQPGTWIVHITVTLKDQTQGSVQVTIS